MNKLGTVTAAVVILGFAAMTGITWAADGCPDPNTCANCGLPQVCCTTPTALLAYETVPHNSDIFRVISAGPPCPPGGIADMVTCGRVDKIGVRGHEASEGVVRAGRGKFAEKL